MTRAGVLTLCLLTLTAARHAGAVAPCAPSPPPTGTTVTVGSDAELQNAVRNLTSGTTILVADGTYLLSNTLHFRGGLTDIALRGASGDRDAVELVGQGMSNASFGNVPHGILVGNITDMLIADLTVRDVYYHPIQIQGESGANGIVMRNLRLVDAGEQFIKGSSGGPPGPYADSCIVECCLIEFTDRARSFYTNGVDVLAGADWIVRDNVFRNIRGPIGVLAGPTILFWRNSLDTLVERNLFLECDRGIALGLSSPDSGNARDGDTTYDHQGGMIRNNVFYRSAGADTADVGIAVNYCRDYSILHNTVILQDSFAWAIEYRFDVSDGVIAHNLTDGQILLRTGASGTLTGNVTNAASDWFEDMAGGDLRLTAMAVAAIDQAPPSPDVARDHEGDPRPQGGASDIGADELSTCTLPSTAVTGLRVARTGADVHLTWNAVAGGADYNVWYVTERSDGGLTRLATAPPAIGVASCSTPSPAGAPSCRDAAAVGRGADVHYYRVRAWCEGAEGP